MELLLKNIGKIGSASVEINGITVIAGENNTGKSTVGRALFAVFNSFYNIQGQIELDRIESVENLLDYMYRNTRTRPGPMIDTEEVARSIISNIGKYRDSDEFIKQDIVDMLLRDGCDLEDKAIDELVSRIKDALNVSNESLLQSVLDKGLNAEFNGQVENIFTEDIGEIELQIKKQRLAVLIKENSVFRVENPDGVTLHTEAIYIDDPFVLDEIRWHNVLFARNGYSHHRVHLRSKISRVRSEGNLVNEAVAKDKFQNIYDKISSVCSGDVVRSKYAGYGYRRGNSDKVLDVKNLSTGLKTFVILKTLLTNGTIQYNGTIILDEPEIHLHPEWQLLLAELVVLIQKEFGVHVLLNTHSPYFLRAIQVYSAKYEMEDSCKYYLSEIVGDYANISDVSDCVEKIYAKLSRPLQDLEDLRWQDD